MVLAAWVVVETGRVVVHMGKATEGGPVVVVVGRMEEVGVEKAMGEETVGEKVVEGVVVKVVGMVVGSKDPKHPNRNPTH